MKVDIPADSRIVGGHGVVVDQVNHPPHYADGRAHEPIDVIEDWQLDFHLGCALKYISRCGRKGSPIEDLRKAIFYLNRKIDLLERERS
jgi:hypothetical protein